VPFSPSTLLSSFVSFCHFCHWLRFLRPPFPVLMLHLREHTPTSAPRCAMLICTLAPTPPMSWLAIGRQPCLIIVLNIKSPELSSLV
jgi:hypothetical protein